jgi:glutathione S-transferase
MFCAGFFGKCALGRRVVRHGRIREGFEGCAWPRPTRPSFIARGEQNFSRFAAVLNDSLKGKTWVLGNRLTLADFSIGGLLPTAERLELPLGRFPEICRWYEGLASLPAWREPLAARDAALALWLCKRAAR